MSKVFVKIEFCIILVFLIRLIGISAPPLETGQNWRQITGLMVTRNYLEDDSNYLFPRVDETKGESGIIGMEFPSLNYIFFCSDESINNKHWCGQLINLIVSSIGLLFFSRIIQKKLIKKVVIASTLFLLGSICFSFSRKMMPDTYFISLMSIGIYYGINYLNQGKTLNVFLQVIFTTLAILSKIPARIYFGLLIPMMFWNPHLSKANGNWYNSEETIPEGFIEIATNLDLVFKNFYFHSFSG